MLQLSYDGRRLYVTNSLYSTWDNQFYPELRSWLLRVNCLRTVEWRSIPTSSLTSTTATEGRRGRTRCAYRVATARPRSSRDPGAAISVLPQAHIAGFPVEEMLLTVFPVVGVVSGWLFIQWKDRLKDRSRGRRQ